jgi:hypothetical protein
MPAASRRRRRMTAAGALFAALLLGAGVLAAQPFVGPTAAFDASVAEYLALRERLRSSVLPEHIIDPHIQGVRGVLLAVHIRDARGEAFPGDIFTPAMSDWIRDALHQTFDGTDVDRLLTERYPGRLPNADAVELNASYPDTIAVRPPPEVLAVLPRVPMPELGYRLIGRDVVLWDEEAAIVVDIVFDALPRPRIWTFLDLSSWELRARITGALGDARLDSSALLDEMRVDIVDRDAPPVVGEPFSWRLGSIMPPSILRALPDLPPPLQYRFVATDLVVIDVETNIVAGILHDALPAGGRLTSRTQ